MVCFLVKEGEVLLARIHYPDGIEYWNGVGGVIEEHELPAKAALREIREEIGVTTSMENLVLRHEFVSSGYYLYVYVVSSWQREPERREPSLKELEWFLFDEVPYKQMFPGNIEWLPKILKG